jgi:AcrR family transcriptional regulator
MDAVAARAHSSKTTIYRRWPGKAELVVDALNCLKGAPSAPDTGSLRGDLDAIAQESASTHHEFDAQLMMGLITALAQNAELRRVFRERLIEPRTEILMEVFERAVARGEVSTDRNIDILGSLFPALILRHLLVFGEIPPARFAQQVIDDVIMPLATAPGVPSDHPHSRTDR